MGRCASAHHLAGACEAAALVTNDRTDPVEGARPRFTFSQRVLHAFFVDGRLTSIPARERKRQVVLRYLASTDFEEGRDYPERDVNMRLASRHRDVAALRRYLVDGGYLERHAGTYRRRPQAAWPGDAEAARPGDAEPAVSDQARRPASPEE